MRSKPLLIGITGGIGAGKSIVAKVFQALNVPVYDADSRAKWLMAHSETLKQNIISEFGAKSYESGELNRTYLASRVFNQPDRLAVLNGLVHPEVGKDFRNWSASQSSDYVLKEAALLYESGSHDELDAILVVSAPEKLRVQRVLARDPHRSAQDIRNIMDRQWPEEQKLSKADFVIRNDETELVIPQVLQIHQQISANLAR